jgi:hypothetical protein
VLSLQMATPAGCCSASYRCTLPWPAGVSSYLQAATAIVALAMMLVLVQ